MLGDFGHGNSYTTYTQKMRSNLNFVRRLSVVKCFEGHNGCVNALNFNPSGECIAVSYCGMNTPNFNPLGQCIVAS